MKLKLLPATMDVVLSCKSEEEDADAVMSQKKLLHELLREDQEPFVLKHYIADRRRLLKKPSSSSTQVQVRKQKSETSTRLRNNFCGSAFRFVLQNNPSSACQTPEFSSPAISPSRHKERDKIIYVVKSLNNLLVEEAGKEQFSPVSILDPPFEDDEGEDDGDDLDCSSATVERLPSKLGRFEKLVELDPVELEKRMYETEKEDDDDDDDDDDFEEEKSTADRFKMKRLIADIVAEERHESVHENTDEVVQRACERSESWEEVKTSTIEMMVERDLKMVNEKKINEEETRETAMDVELAIFVFLIEELAIELDG